MHRKPIIDPHYNICIRLCRARANLAFHPPRQEATNNEKTTYLFTFFMPCTYIFVPRLPEFAQKFPIFRNGVKERWLLLVQLVVGLVSGCHSGWIVQNQRARSQNHNSIKPNPSNDRTSNLLSTCILGDNYQLKQLACMSHTGRNGAGKVH